MAKVLRRSSRRTGRIMYGRFNSMFRISDPYSWHFDWVFEKRNAATVDAFPEHLIWKLNQNEPSDSEWIYEEEDI